MQFSVALSRDGNFTGPVTISLEGGVTNVVSVPASITTTGTVATFGIRAASNADGAGTILVRATTGEVETEQARNVVVTVVPTPAGVGNVTHRFCDEKPVWLAASDGNGPWRRIPEASPGVFTYSVGARGSMAYVTTTATSNTLHVFQLNAAELKALANRTCALTHDSVTVPFSGLTTGEYVSTTIGADGVTTTATSSHATVTFKPVVSADSSDLVAYTVTPAGMFNRLVTKRALVLRAGLVLPVVDFDGADVVPFVSAMLNLALPPALSGALSVTTSLTTASSRTTAQLDTKLLASGVTSTATPSFVAGTLKGGDVVERHISSAPGNSAIDTFQAYYYDAGGITPSFVVPSFSRNWTLLTTPSAMYGRVGIRVPAEAGWDQTLQFVGQHADGSRRVELLTSALYDPDMSITTPDFSNTDGWNDAWGPRVGVALDVTLTRGGGVGRTGTLFDVVSGRSWLALAQRNISIVP
jgi:hypothetical protein